MEREPVEAIKTIEQYQDRPTFVIRAHHLNQFIQLLRSGGSVSNFEGTYFGHLERERASRYIPEHRQWYLNDVLGSTQEQADRYRRYKTEFYEEFLQLPLDYPVKIAQGQKDKICQGCAIGEHCSKKALPENCEDKTLIEDFRNAAKKLNLEDDLTVVGEIATYSNAKPEEVESIITTAQTVKKVILSWSGASLVWLER